MRNRLNFNATINLVSYLLIGLTYYFKWSPVVAMIGFVLSIVVLVSSVINIFLVNKEEKTSKKIYIRRIIFQMLLAAILIFIYMGRFNIE